MSNINFKNQKILETKDLVKTFKAIHAVDNLNLSFEKAKVYGIIGPNGSGKTTFINLLTGLIPIDKGEVFIGDKNLFKKINTENIFSYKISRTFQAVRIIGQISVLDNILITLTKKNLFASLFEKNNKQHIEKADKILKMIGLYEKRNVNGENLSFGQRKLLEIGRAISSDAEIILFDEPFSGLFKERIKEVSEIIKNLKEENKCIILVEHNMDIIRDITDYCFVLDSGKLIAEGEPDKVLENQEVIEAYLGR